MKRRKAMHTKFWACLVSPEWIEVRASPEKPVIHWSRIKREIDKLEFYVGVTTDRNGVRTQAYKSRIVKAPLVLECYVPKGGNVLFRANINRFIAAIGAIYVPSKDKVVELPARFGPSVTDKNWVRQRIKGELPVVPARPGTYSTFTTISPAPSNGSW